MTDRKFFLQEMFLVGRVEMGRRKTEAYWCLKETKVNENNLREPKIKSSLFLKNSMA